MKTLRAVLFAGALLAMPADAASEQPNVVASIKPIHSLVAGVMQGVEAPRLLVSGSQSPHDYAMKPSDAEALQRAAVVFWIGPELERFLEKPLETLAGNATVVPLEDAPGVTRLKFREAGPLDADDDDHGKPDHDTHAEDDYAHEAAGGHDGHGHGDTDMHLWLDPINAKAFVRQIANALATADPNNAATYASNAGSLAQRLDALVVEVAAGLAPVAGRPFVVFHDGYQYFEARFALKAAVSITVIPDVMPGAGRLRAARDKVKALGATCVFAEPQFDPKLVGVVTSGTEARAGVLDPLGAGLDDGPNLYFELIRGMATAIIDCLAATR